MAKAWDGLNRAMGVTAKPLDWRKRISDNIAYALLVYTALQIVVTMGTLESKGGSLLPYFALIILVAAIIPACRRFEKRWSRLNDEQAADPAFSRYYRRDQLWLWLLAIGLPFAVSGLFMGIAKLAG
ncbi:MAG: hypothetical protein ACKOPG_07815 [Novosphingobium sp.]